MPAVLLLVVLGLGVLVGAVVIYNGLVALRNRAESAWADIGTQLKRRHDLIPNLVETVKGYAGHEKATLESVIEARNAAGYAKGAAEQGKAENVLQGALKNLFALAEAYPDLKANTNFLSLQNSLNEVEQHLQHARQYYNAVVRDLNTKVEQFPSNVIAGMGGFRKMDYFEVEEAATAVPKVDFG